MVRIYEHRCAFCGIRMMTPEGHTVVDAAHIVPWSESYDDSPQNGLCLCKLCHWSFDEHFMHLDGEYRIMISPLVQSGRNLPGLIMSLDGRHMILPDDKRYWPGKENIERHRKCN
jgi:putative restriction endonuclease